MDLFKVGDVNVHELAASSEVTPNAQKVFGKSDVYVALAPEALFITFGPQGKELIKEALSVKLARSRRP